MKSINNFVEKHYSKLLKGALSIFALSLLTFTFTLGGSVSGTKSAWRDEVIFKANVDISDKGQKTVDELLARDINVGSPSELDSYIKEQEQLLAKLLVEYYEAQASGLVDSYDLEPLKAQIRNIQSNLLIEYKKLIDEELEKYDLL